LGFQWAEERLRRLFFSNCMNGLLKWLKMESLHWQSILRRYGRKGTYATCWWSYRNRSIEENLALFEGMKMDFQKEVMFYVLKLIWLIC
jgi:hypothetical protein